MDYFIKCLKDNGIYFNFCIQAGRIFKESDGIDFPIQNNQSKYVTLFNKKLIDLQKDFAGKIIGHVNPYTGLKYSDDPAMATIELTNENSLFQGWLSWNSNTLFEGNNSGIGNYYANELDELFNDWINSKYEKDEELKAAWSEEYIIEPEELIRNGSFEQELSAWSTLISGGAKGSIEIDTITVKDGDKSAKIVVTEAGSEFWNIQLKSNEFKVKKDNYYKISFYLKANKEKEVRLEIMENLTWKFVSGPLYITSTDWKLYDFFIRCPFDSDAVVLAFGWGREPGIFWIDSVSVMQTSGITLDKEESLVLNNIKRVKNSDFNKYTKYRIGDNANFYYDIEHNYISEMITFLKSDLDVKCPVTFTNNYFGLASIYSQAGADYIDFHKYWNHPSFPDGWSTINFTLKNQSMLLDPKGSTINKMLLNKVKNKPLVLSEYNHPYPYIYQAEAPSLLYAYGSFYNLDGIMWHAYYDYMDNFSQRKQDMFFDIAMNPVIMTQLLLALPYRMKYIKNAEKSIEAYYSADDIFNNTKYYQTSDVINIENTDYGTSLLQHGFQHASFDADSSYLSEPFNQTENIITTDTGELMWNGTDGYFSVNNPYWQGVTGFLGNKTFDLDDITLSNVETTDNLNFAAIHLISLDSLPISQSKRMILLTSARLENEGLLWNESKTSLVSAGGTRALCEPVTATLDFKPASIDSFEVFMLDVRGNREDSIPVSQSLDGVSVHIGNKTLWYEITNHQVNSVPVGFKNTINQKNQNLRIWPNPGRNYAMVEYNLWNENRYPQFVLFNMTGQLIQNEKVKADQNRVLRKKINLNELQNGIYFCGFQFEDGTKKLEKLVVRK
jgi:hypothetical protein